MELEMLCLDHKLKVISILLSHGPYVGYQGCKHCRYHLISA